MKRNLYRIIGFAAILLMALQSQSFAAHLPANAGPGDKKVITGTVRDDAGETIPGATVQIKGTSKGVSTDLNGAYSIEVKDDDILVVSFLGMETVEMPVSNRKKINVTLTQGKLFIDDAVVIGYGSVSKRDLTGSVGSVTSTAFSQQSITDINQALSGQIAGVNIMNTSGTPGGGLDIQIRGVSTIGADSTPLYVVDDIPMQFSGSAESNPLSFINPSDIKSIDVLKDASAAAIYGSRASNGVVIITTKSGTVGKPKVNFVVKESLQQLYNKVDMMDGRQFAELAIEARNNTLIDQGKGDASTPDSERADNLKTGYFQQFLDSGEKGTDWQDVIYHPAWMQDYQITLSGGTPSVKYLTSAGVLVQDGIMKNTGFTRYTVRSNVDIKVNDRISVGFKLNPSYTDQDFLPATGRYHNANSGITQGALVCNPLMPVYDETSLSGFSVGLGQGHALANCENPYTKVCLLKDARRNFILLGSAYLSYKITNTLTFRLNGSTNIRSASRFYKVPSLIASYSNVPPVENEIGSVSDNSFNFQTSAQLTWNKRWSSGHHIVATGVYEMQTEQRRSVTAKSHGTWTDDLIVVDSNLSSYIREGYSSITEWAIMSGIGRLSYDFKDKYLLSASIRADGSSKFAKRWGYFPSAALAWRVSKENFMRSAHWLSDLKLRTSFGVTGNNSIGNYQYMSLMGGSNAVFGANGESIISGIKHNSLGNPDLTWEKTRQYNAGFDISIFNDRFSLSADAYEKYTYDLLLSLQVPSTLGFTNLMTNIGKIRNRGLEFTLNTRNLVGKFKWNTNFNISMNRQTVLALGPEGDPLMGSSVYFENTHITQVGKPMGQFYGLKVIGVYQNWDQVNNMPGVGKGTNACSRPGEYIFEDYFEDYKITAADRTIIGDPNPDFTFGMTNNFSLGNWQLSVFLRGAIGGELLNFNFGSAINQMTTNMPTSLYYNRWKSEAEPGDGKTSRVALNNRGTLGNETLNSSFVEDASFVNIQNVSLSYMVPSRFLDKINISDLKFVLSAQNLHMFTSYNGYNPEGGMNMGSTLAPGVDWGRYPLARVFSLSANITF